MKAAQKKGMAGNFIGTFIFALLNMYVLAHFVKYVNATTFWDGAVLGFWAWLGFIVPVTLNSVFWENKSWKVWLINAGHVLVGMAIGAGIVTVWA